jgi:hypothetical protein
VYCRRTSVFFRRASCAGDGSYQLLGDAFTLKGTSRSTVGRRVDATPADVFGPPRVGWNEYHGTEMVQRIENIEWITVRWERFQRQRLHHSNFPYRHFSYLNRGSYCILPVQRVSRMVTQDLISRSNFVNKFEVMHNE